jgi:hypothetical protein
MMKPTRRGFLGSLAAIVAAPTAMIADSGRRVASGVQKSITVVHNNEPAVIKFCTMQFIGDDGLEMMFCGMVPYTTEQFGTNQFHFKADLGEMGKDFGIGIKAFGPIHRIITTIETDIGPIEIFSDLSYLSHFNAGDHAYVEFDAFIDPT